MSYTLTTLFFVTIGATPAIAGIKASVDKAFNGSAIEQAERTVKKNEKQLEKQIRMDAKNDNLSERRNAQLERKENLIKARTEITGSAAGSTLDRAKAASAAYEKAEESAKKELETYQNSAERGSKGVFGSLKQKLKEHKVQKAQERLDRISMEREKADHLVNRIDSHNSKKDSHESTRSQQTSSGAASPAGSMHSGHTN